MVKNIFLSLCLMIVVVLSFYSCNTEEDYLKNEDTKPQKFSVFSAQEDQPVNYANGFKLLMEKHDEINSEQHTLKALNKAYSAKSSDMSDEYIEFNIRSQDIIVNEKDLYVLFPMIKNYQVAGILAAVLKDDETRVEFIKVNPEIEKEYYQTVLELFSTQYKKSTSNNKSANKGAGGGCGFPRAPACDIDEVIITIPNPQPGNGWNGFRLEA